MSKKILYIIFGFVFGCLVANLFFIPELMAQYQEWRGSGTFEETVMEPPVPAGYGQLVAVSGIRLYFQNEEGNIYIVNPKTSTKLDTEVSVIKRR